MRQCVYSNLDYCIKNILYKFGEPYKLYRLSKNCGSECRIGRDVVISTNSRQAGRAEFPSQVSNFRRHARPVSVNFVLPPRPSLGCPKHTQSTREERLHRITTKWAKLGLSVYAIEDFKNHMSTKNNLKTKLTVEWCKKYQWF